MFVTLPTSQFEISALNVVFSAKAACMFVTSLTSQSGIEPYSLKEHNPSTGFVLKHVEIALAKLLSVSIALHVAAFKIPALHEVTPDIL
jgi:cytochrome b